MVLSNDLFNAEYPFGQNCELRDDLGRLHAPDFGNGFAKITKTRCTGYREGKLHGIDVDKFGSCTFYYDGVMVPPNYVNRPEDLKFDEVIKHKNTEVRYVGMKIYGYERMREEKRFIVLDTDEEKGQELLKFDGAMDEPIILVKVINGTPEPNGTYKEYFLHVPPTITTCKQAVAWTFGKEEKTYHPSQET